MDKVNTNFPLGLTISKKSILFNKNRIFMIKIVKLFFRINGKSFCFS